MNILLAVPRHPWPPRRGDQLRALQLTELLTALGHRVHLLAPQPDTGEARVPDAFPGEVTLYRPAGRGQQMVGLGRALSAGYPLQTAFFASRDLEQQLHLRAPAADLVIVQLLRLAPCLPLLEALPQGGPPVVLDFIDSLALNFHQWATVAPPPKSWLLRHEAARLARWESEVLRHTAGALVVCDRDREVILGRPGAGSVPAERLLTLPLAFPLGPATTAAAAATVPAAVPTLAMTGNLGYFVTADGFGRWLREVWPELRQRLPEARLMVAGARPAAALRHAAQQPGVTLIADPPELLPYLRCAHIALAPLRFGAGQPLKILEAWQEGVPVIASPWAAAGTTGVAGRDFLLAKNPGEWVESVARLLADGDLREGLARAARERLQRDYSREPLRQRLQDWLAALKP